jgi:hypothetical protein
VVCLETFLLRWWLDSDECTRDFVSLWTQCKIPDGRKGVKVVQGSPATSRPVRLSIAEFERQCLADERKEAQFDTVADCTLALSTPPRRLYAEVRHLTAAWTYNLAQSSTSELLCRRGNFLCGFQIAPSEARLTRSSWGLVSIQAEYTMVDRGRILPIDKPR